MMRAFSSHMHFNQAQPASLDNTTNPTSTIVQNSDTTGKGTIASSGRRRSRHLSNLLFPPSPTSTTTTTTSSSPTNSVPSTAASPKTPTSIFSFSSLFSKMPTASSTSSSKTWTGGEALSTEDRLRAVHKATEIANTVGTNWDWEKSHARRERKRKRAQPPMDEPEDVEAEARLSEDVSTVTLSDSASGYSTDTNASYLSRTSSDSDSAPPPSKATARKQSLVSTKSVYPDDTSKSAYRFSSPDEVGLKLSKAEKRAKRRLAATEEMKWNDGLKAWSTRRDDWTSADDLGRVPRGKSRFEGNPLKRLIKPDQYSQIYSKVIIGSQTPPIPINLQDLTNAMVQGWKADDQWPPKPQRPEPMFSKKKPAGVGESMVQKVFGKIPGR